MHPRRIEGILISAIVWFQVVGAMSPSVASQKIEKSVMRTPISVAIRTDRQKYSMADFVKLYISLENASADTVYVDRRFLFGGPIYGLTLEIRDEKGNLVLSGGYADARMVPPPPKDGDVSILIRLDEECFYGMWVKVPVKGRFLKPGKYSIQVEYKSWLERDQVPPQLQDLPAIWKGSPSVPSMSVWVEITE
jgi:hypothetical protein